MKAKTTIGRVSSHFAVFTLAAVLFHFFVIERAKQMPEARELLGELPPIMEIIILGVAIGGALMGLSAATLYRDRTLQVFLSLAFFGLVFGGFYWLYIR